MAECIYTSCITSFWMRRHCAITCDVEEPFERRKFLCQLLWRLLKSSIACSAQFQSVFYGISLRRWLRRERNEKYYRNLFLKPVHEFKACETFLNIVSLRSMLRQHKGEGNLPAIHEEAGLHFPRNFTVDLIRTWGVSCVGRNAITSRHRPALRNIPTSRALFFCLGMNISEVMFCKFININTFRSLSWL